MSVDSGSVSPMSSETISRTIVSFYLLELYLFFPLCLSTLFWHHPVLPTTSKALFKRGCQRKFTTWSNWVHGFGKRYPYLVPYPYCYLVPYPYLVPHPNFKITFRDHSLISWSNWGIQGFENGTLIWYSTTQPILP